MAWLTLSCFTKQTLNTLRYANRARNIRNTPVVNRERPNVGDLRSEIESLQWQLQQQQQKQSVSHDLSFCSRPTHGCEDVVPLSKRVLKVDRYTHDLISLLHGIRGRL